MEQKASETEEMEEEDEDGEFEVAPEDLGEGSSGNEEMDSVTESIVVQL